MMKLQWGIDFTTPQALDGSESAVRNPTAAWKIAFDVTRNVQYSLVAKNHSSEYTVEIYIRKVEN